MIRAACLALALLSANTARAADGDPLTGTLKIVADRGTILLGVREAAVPFAFTNKAGQAVGFSVDLCRGIAADVAALLGRDLLEPGAPAWQAGLRIVFVPVAADARLPMVVSGAVDLECGSTTANEARARTVAFSPVFFLAGTKLLVPAGSAITAFRDAGGKTIAVSAGTTNAEVIHRLATRMDADKVVETPDVATAYALLAAGKADAVASDDVLLAGLVASRPDGRQFRVVGDFLSFEPYAIMLRKDDPAFSALVRRSFERMAQDGTLSTRYRRWFTDALPGGENLDLPMSAQLTEMYRALGEPD